MWLSSRMLQIEEQAFEAAMAALSLSEIDVALAAERQDGEGKGRWRRSVNGLRLTAS